MRVVLAGLDGAVSELVRQDNFFKDLGLVGTDYESVEDVVALLVEHPRLMQRPLLVRGTRALIARPPEQITDFLGPS